MADENTLWIVADTEEPTPEPGRRDGTRDMGDGFGSRRAGRDENNRRKRVPVDSMLLKSQMQGLLAVVNDLF